MTHRSATCCLASALAVILSIFPASSVRGADSNAEKETDPAVLANLEKFKDMKFGLFIHWGPCSQWGARIAWPLSESQPWARPDDLPAWVERKKNFKVFVRDYFDLNKTFNPRHFEPELWAKAAKKAGMKYVVFVSKCHDGFAMFDTKLSNYCVTDPSCRFHTNPRANIAKEVLDAFRNEGIRTAFYFSMPDWHHPDYEDPELPAQRLFRPNYDVKKHPEKWQRYLDFMHGQIKELLSNYGPIDIIWLDGGAGNDWQTDKLAAMARRLQPGILVVHRGEGGRYENYRTPEQQIPAQALPYPWETCLTMGDYWAYNPKDYYKPARELIQLLVEIVCKGGNLLLDVGPDAEGRFPPEAMARLEELGQWMQYNGEALYGTRPVAPYKEGRVCFTRKGDSVYLIQLADLAQNKPPWVIAVSSIQPAEGSAVTLVGKNLPLKWEKRGNGAVIYIPPSISSPIIGERAFCRHAWAVKIDKAIVQSDHPSPPQTAGSK
ncbi:MAG: alpha-L-fucosidase [Pirellulales bacterium]|nr:alpha-L-fucosidase [Pirellulales bacterium]